MGQRNTSQVPAHVLDFLSRPESYPEQPTRVEIIETHMSWVFLLDRHVYKLKKPVQRPFLDFRSLAARKRFCLEEVRLNRRLAPDVYLGIVPLTGTDGGLVLGGGGPVRDWLVCMRRLPAERMLDRMIASGEPSSAELYRVSRLLISFYRSAPRRRLAPEWFILRLRREVALNRLDLIDPRRSPSPGLARSLCACHLRFVDLHLPLLHKRAARICEAHGDLRPEHLCLEPQPIAIDRLEFEPTFRLLDPVDELSYLAMECERLGSERVGTKLLDGYMTSLGDHVPEPLIAFYKGVRACQRARLAVLHLHEDSPSTAREHWLRRASAYLNLAARHVGAASSIITVAPPLAGEGRSGVGRLAQVARSRISAPADLPKTSVS
ncbi:MAG TPA: hypothetical protein VED46_07830 [Alphaproteobacteria bacterium]|nr:hypothetical protein [Alphaproteobacteria bacterium]